MLQIFSDEPYGVCPQRTRQRPGRQRILRITAQCAQDANQNQNGTDDTERIIEPVPAQSPSGLPRARLFPSLLSLVQAQYSRRIVASTNSDGRHFTRRDWFRQISVTSMFQCDSLKSACTNHLWLGRHEIRFAASLRGCNIARRGGTMGAVSPRVMSWSFIHSADRSIVVQAAHSLRRSLICLAILLVIDLFSIFPTG